jgi:hypothetical protein
LLSASFDVPLEVVDINLRIGRDKRGNAGTNLREGLSEGLHGIHLDHVVAKPHPAATPTVARTGVATKGEIVK